MVSKTYKLKDSWGDIVDITFTKANYEKRYGGGFAIQMWCEDGPYATLTVNLYPKKCEKNCAFVDTNNLGFKIVEWLESNGIAEWTYRIERSGFCEYPEMKFNAEFLESL